LGKFFRAEGEVRKSFIVILTQMAKESSWREIVSVDFITEMMTAFSSDLHEQNVKQWLGLFAELSQSLVFSKEFLRRGGLRTLLSMLRIPHINIVFLVVRVLKAIKAHGLIDTPEFSNASRQQLAQFLSDYHQEKPKSKVPSTMPTPTKKTVVQRVAAKLIQPVNANPKIEIPSAQPIVSTKSTPRSDVPPNAEPTTVKKSVAPEKPKKSEKVKVVVPKPETKAEKKSIEVRRTSLVSQNNEIDSNQQQLGAEQFRSPILEELLILQSYTNVEAQVHHLRKIQRYLSHEKVSKELCGAVCDALIPLVQVTDSRVFIETCTILHYIACFEDLHETLKEKEIVKVLIDVVNGYNLERIEYSLWTLEKFCSNNTSIMNAVEYNIIPALGVVMNSGMENVRLYSQFILKRIAKIDKPELHEELKNLHINNPWHKVSKGWNEIMPWSPADYII
jgi:hypothetical protein